MRTYRSDRDNCSLPSRRTRRHRERRRDGFCRLWVEMHVTEIDALTRMRLLQEETSNEPNEVRRRCGTLMEPKILTLESPRWAEFARQLVEAMYVSAHFPRRCARFVEETLDRLAVAATALECSL
jgi:hypothetical protein